MIIDKSLEELNDRLVADSATNPKGNGYVSTVTDRGPEGARFRKPDRILDSGKTFNDSGVFESHDDAVAFAVRWKAGHIALQIREYKLRVTRGLELAGRLREAASLSSQLELDKKMIANQIKALDDRRTTLVREANDPEVELDIRPSGDAWRLYDAPSESEGTLDANHRQLVLGGSGVDGPEPVEVERDPPLKAAKEKANTGRKSRAPAAKKAPKKGAKRRTAKKSKGSTVRVVPTKPGLDPGAVAWPEDDPS